MSDEQWLSFLNRLYIAVAILTATLSFFIYYVGTRVSKSIDARIATAQTAAQQAVARQKQAELETETIRQENLKLRIELEKLKRESDRRWHRIAGGTLER